MTTCPFCGCDPFHYVDNGVGMEAVAVTCCENGDAFFRGARPAPETVTLLWDEFQEIGGKLLDGRSLREVNADLLDALKLLLREEEAGTVCELDRQTARDAIAKAELILG